MARFRVKKVRGRRTTIQEQKDYHRIAGESESTVQAVTHRDRKFYARQAKYDRKQRPDPGQGRTLTAHCHNCNRRLTESQARTHHDLGHRVSYVQAGQ